MTIEYILEEEREYEIVFHQRSSLFDKELENNFYKFADETIPEKEKSSILLAI